MVKVKICGITSPAIARGAVEAGADAIGFVFAASRRRVTPEFARTVIRSLPPFVITVGVFVDEEITVVRRVVDYCGLSMAQLHGAESPDYCRELGRPVLKAIRVAGAGDLEKMAQYQGLVRGFLLDTLVPGQPGGTGKTFPWHLAREAKKYGPIIVAGGLTPDNVGQALQEAAPYGVDVSSGVETDGAKDLSKIRAFIKRVRRNNYEA